MNEYFYLGLEARLRTNKFFTLEDAVEIAVHAASRIGIPVRIFKMPDNKKPVLIETIRPGNPILSDELENKWHRR